MIFQKTLVNCRISPEADKHLNYHLEKISRALEDYDPDLPLVRFTLRKDIDRYHPPRRHLSKNKTYADAKPALSYFTGSIYFCLSRNRMYARLKGQTVDECIDLGFKRIFKKLEKYKDKHFPSESEYPDHSTIRGA